MSKFPALVFTYPWGKKDKKRDILPAQLVLDEDDQHEENVGDHAHGGEEHQDPRLTLCVLLHWAIQNHHLKGLVSRELQVIRA